MNVRIYNSNLDPNLWDENKHLKPEIRQHLLKIATDFYKGTGFKGPMVDALFLGSSTNYNWSAESDIDLHILVDLSKEKIHPDYARNFMDVLAKKWNGEHDIEIKGHPIEMYMQSTAETNKSEASYSICHDKWIKPPQPKEIHLDKEAIRRKYAQLRKMIENAIKHQNVPILEQLMKRLKNYRQTGLNKTGEFSTENVVFKLLRHTGYIDKLWNSINDIYDAQLTLKEASLSPAQKKSNEYAITGWIAPDLEIDAQKYTTTGNDYVRHGQLSRGVQWNGAVKWRYRSEGNTVLWGSEPNNEQKETVVDWLQHKFGVSNPRHVSAEGLNAQQKINMHYVGQRYLKEMKHDPFTSPVSQFVTFGGISLTKQKGFDNKELLKPMTYHAPPARKGIYAFPWPFIDKFLLGGGYSDPKKRGKGQRNRITYVKDKEGNPIKTGHPDYEKVINQEKGKNWSFTRNKDNEPWDHDKHDWEKEDPVHVLYRNSHRKKFKYNGEVWHHLEEFVKEHEILDRKGAWVKTDMNTFQNALRKRLHSTMTWDAKQNKGKQFRGLGNTSHSWEDLEVFIDSKI